MTCQYELVRNLWFINWKWPSPISARTFHTISQALRGSLALLHQAPCWGQAGLLRAVPSGAESPTPRMKLPSQWGKASSTCLVQNSVSVQWGTWFPLHVHLLQLGPQFLLASPLLQPQLTESPSEVVPVTHIYEITILVVHLNLKHLCHRNISTAQISCEMKK